MEEIIAKYLSPDDTGLSLYTASGIGSVLEIEGPKGGRDRHCFRRAYHRWKGETPFSGQTFFD